MSKSNRTALPESKFQRTSDFPSWTVVSHGTPHAFVPFFETVDPVTNTKRKLLDIHSDYVRMMNDPAVYLLDQNGDRVVV